MTLRIAVRHQVGGFALDAAFESAGRLTALFGASGSGKTTLINLIAGLMRPATGRIEIDGRVLVDTASGTWTPRHRRRIGYVFQEARLFPHLTVRSNLRYGAWFSPAAERYGDFGHVVELLGIGGLLDRRPALLSGGEKQRVAIGRALLSSPRLILMDEPLASLDDPRKNEILPYIERLRDEMRIPIVYVSHSIAEVTRLATDIVVLSSGKVLAAGTTPDIVRQLDLLPEEERGEGGAVLDTVVAGNDAAFGMTLLRCAAGEFRVAGLDAADGASVRIRIRAREVMIATEKPRGLSALNVIEGRISGIRSDDGPLADITLDCTGQAIIARITRLSCDSLGLAVGRDVFAVVKTVSFDRSTTGRVVSAG